MPLVASRPLRSWPDRVPSDNRTLGWHVLAWTSEYLVQPDGVSAGEPWRYTDEQVRVLLRWYQIDARGRFVHRRGVLRRMKGWGKDPFLASLAAVELCGPCRFGGWDSGRAPIAVQHPAPWIQVAAVSKDQNRNTMVLFPGLFSPEAIAEYRVDLGKEIIYARGVGRIEAVTSSPRALEGGRPSLVIANETHHWLETNEGLEMMAAIRRNLAKSRDGSGRVMEITNAHLPGEGSAAEATHDAWAESGGKLDGVYYDSVEAPPLEDLGDTAALRRGLLAARGDSTWVDVDHLVKEIQDPTTPETISRRFYLNQVTKAGSAWLPDGTWDACAVKGVSIADQAEVVLGFDGSKNHDVTVVVAVSVGVRPHVQVVGAWMRPDNEPFWEVPRAQVKDTIRAACKRWKVREIAWDEYLWLDSAEELADEGLPVVEFPQNMTRMGPATQRFYEAVVSRELTHSDDPLLRSHVANARTKTDSRGTRLVKDSKGSPRKIDLAIAAVMAHDRAAILAREQTGVNVGSFREYSSRFTPEQLAEKRAAYEARVKGIMERARGGGS